MATPDLEATRRRAQRRLEQLESQLNRDLPAKIREVRQDIERLDKAIAAVRAQVDASDLLTKYANDTTA